MRLTPRGPKMLEAMLPEYYRQVAELMGGLTDDGKASWSTC